MVSGRGSVVAMQPPVADTSTLKTFTEIGRLDLLLAIFPVVMVPPAVIGELEQMSSKGNLDLLAQVRRGVELKPSALSIEAFELSKRYALRLGAGESEVIALARTDGVLALLDDLKARQIAKADGVRLVGSLGILALVKERGFVCEVGPVLDAMIAGGRYLGRPDFLRRYLRELGE